MLNSLARKIWNTSQLMPDEEVEDGVKRIESVLLENFNKCFFCGTQTQPSKKGQICPACGGRPV